MFKMASILVGSILIPSLDIMCPKGLPSSSPKSVFLGFKEIPKFLHLMKLFSNEIDVHCLFWRILLYCLDK